MSFAVEMHGITKRFGSVEALTSVDLRVEKGTIHALIGENGAGKTTLMNILYGRFPATEGTFQVDGQELRFKNSAEAIRAGIGMVSQHYAIIPELSCLQNLILGAEPSWTLSLAKLKMRATELAQRMGFSFDWEAEAATLSPAAAQKLEILKLLWREARIMILDEPTAMLSPQDSDALFASLRELASHGATVIVVTHRLPEVLEHCVRATVLRGGKKVGDIEVKDANPAILAEMIVGHAVAAPSERHHAANAPILEVKNLVAKDYRGFPTLDGVSFEVRAGEVLGLAGVDGSGQRELFATLMGAQKPESGSVSFEGRDIAKLTTRERLAMGIAWVPEDRHEEAIIEGWSLIDNAALGAQDRPPFARGPWAMAEPRREAAQAMADRFSTKHGGLDRPIADLSGGNQQRFVNGRALAGGPKLLLAFQPARGLDIEATRRFYEALYEACNAGAAALVVSFDLDELLAYCDRIVVANRGKIRNATSKDRQEVGQLMVASE